MYKMDMIVDNIDDAYANVRTLEDLCQINKDFIDGTYETSAYRCGPYDYVDNPVLDKYMSKDDIESITKDLLDLNSTGFYTTDYSPTQQSVVFRHEGGGDLWSCVYGREYLTGALDTEKAYALIEYLAKPENKHIHYMLEEGMRIPGDNTQKNVILTNINFTNARAYELTELVYIDAPADAPHEEVNKRAIAARSPSVYTPDYGEALHATGGHREEILSTHEEYERVHAILADMCIIVLVDTQPESMAVATREHSPESTLLKVVNDFFVNNK